MQTCIKPVLMQREIIKLNQEVGAALLWDFRLQWLCFTCVCQLYTAQGIFCKLRHYGVITNTNERNNSEKNNNIPPQSNKFVLYYHFRNTTDAMHYAV